MEWFKLMPLDMFRVIKEGLHEGSGLAWSYVAHRTNNAWEH